MEEIDYSISLMQLQGYSDEDLNILMEYSKKDKENDFRAACIYYMCMMDFQRRNEDSEQENMKVKCISNLYDEDSDKIFDFEKCYEMYSIDNIMLIYDGKMIPYIFDITEESNRCVWKYFGLWEDDKPQVYYSS